MTEIIELLKAYDFYDPVDTIERVSMGNINMTYKIICSNGKKYILQRINNTVFTDVDGLMENIEKTTERLMALKIQKSLDKMQVIKIKSTRDGKSFVFFNEKYYRVYEFMKGCQTFSYVSSLARIADAGRTFGDFFTLLNTGEPISLNCTIRDFHNTPLRLKKLEQSFEKAPKTHKKRAKSVYDYICENKKRVDLYHKKLKRLPVRIVHNDTKISNIAFDCDTGEAIGVLDLDTVMPGYPAFDFADAVRSIAGPTREDERNHDLVSLNVDRYEALADGYLQSVKNEITKSEVMLFPEAVFQITVELAARFLTDYLDGNIYFNTEYEDQNFYRAICQASLAADIDSKMKTLKKVAYNAYKTTNHV